MSTRPLTTIVDLWEWNAKGGAPRPVRLRATVTYFDPAWRILNVQEGNTALFINPADEPKDIVPGTVVEIAGVSDPADGVSQISLTKLEVAGLPKPLPASVSEIAKGLHPAVLVETTGLVRSVRVMDSRPTLRLAVGQSVINVRVLQGDAAALGSLLNSVVRVTGVESPPIDATRAVGELFVPSAKMIEVIERGSSDLFSLSVATTDEVEAAADSGGSAVRIRQRLLRRDGDNVWVLGTHDSPIRIRTIERVIATPGDVLDVAGFPVVEPNGITLNDAQVRLVLSPGRFIFPVLTRVADITTLTPEEASSAIPVKLTATVTFFDPWWQVLFVQDGSGGVYVENAPPSLQVKPGDLVHIEARTAPGGFAPDIAQPKIKLLRSGTLPPPARPSIDDLMVGRFDSQRIRVSGVVRSANVRMDSRRLFIQLAASNSLIEVQVLQPEAIQNPERLVDSKVELIGVAATSVNPTMQTIATTLLVGRADDLKVIEPGAPDPFQQPKREIDSLLRFGAPVRLQHRVHVDGVVLSQRGETLYVRDQSGSIAVKLQLPGEFPAGSVVDVVGFVSLGATRPEVVQAMAISRGMVRIPPAPLIAADEVLKGPFDASLVSVEGTVLSSAQLPRFVDILLQANGQTFNATLPAGSRSSQSERMKIAPGALVRVTGIVQLQMGGPSSSPTPASFKLQLRNSDDFKVLQNPPWWTARHLLVLALVLLSVAGAALLWVVLLKRQVHRQTALIRQQTAGLMRSEKLAGIGQLVAGVAHELNNPLTAIMGYSDLLLDETQDESQRQKLDRVGAEARRMKRIIENLLNFSRPNASQRRPVEIEAVVRNTLVLCESTLRGKKIEVQLQFDPNLPQLELDENQLQSVLLNIFSNSSHALEAVKFRKILVEGRIEDDTVTLRFSDSGPGFPDVHRAFEPFYTTKPVGQGTGLGLSICYGLVKENGGEIHAENLHPTGALVMIRFPLRRRLRPEHRLRTIKDRIASHVLFRRESSPEEESEPVPQNSDAPER